MLGFGALGEFALGEGPFGSQTLTPGPGWQSGVAKKAISAAVIATTFAGFVPPVPTTPTVFAAFSQPSRAANLATQISWVQTPVVPAQAAALFTTFSQPAFLRVNLPDEQPSALFEIAPPQPSPFTGFLAFSLPLSNRTLLPDEQPSALFEVLPPQSPPFTGFAQFTGQIRVKANPSTGFQSFLFVPSTPDTHDLVFDVYRKKKPRRDLIDEELARKAKLRAGLELAAYGPPLEISYESIPEALPVAAPPDVAGLTKTILQAQEAQQQAMQAKHIADEEDDLEMILKEIG